LNFPPADGGIFRLPTRIIGSYLKAGRKRFPDEICEIEHPFIRCWSEGGDRVVLDLKSPGGVAAVLRLVGQADALIEGP